MTDKFNLAQANKEKAIKKRDEKIEETAKLQKQLDQLQNERDKLKNKILKLKRRRNVDFNQKICKLCGREYLENENFNWSCRTHRVSLCNLRDNTEERCGGVAANQLRKLKAASLANTKVKTMKKKIIKRKTSITQKLLNELNAL